MNFIDRSRKGQVTPFIIVGILIVVIAGAILFINRSEVGRVGLSDDQIEPVRTYLRDCAENYVNGVIIDMRNYGGHTQFVIEDPLTGTPIDDFVECGGINAKVISSPNIAISDLSVGLEKEIRDNLFTACSLTDFDRSFSIINPEVDVDVSFGDKVVDVVLDFDVEASRGGSGLGIGKILVSSDNDIFEVNEIAKYVADEFAKGRDESIITTEVMGGDVFLTRLFDNTLVYSNNVLGCSEDDVDVCEVECPGNCCIVKTKFSETNGLEVFRFGLKDGI